MFWSDASEEVVAEAVGMLRNYVTKGVSGFRWESAARDVLRYFGQFSKEAEAHAAQVVRRFVPGTPEAWSSIVWTDEALESVVCMMVFGAKFYDKYTTFRLKVPAKSAKLESTKSPRVTKPLGEEAARAAGIPSPVPPVPPLPPPPPVG